MESINIKDSSVITEKSSFEEQIEKNGKLVYTNVGDSMMPLIKQGRDLIVISRKPDGRLRKYDVPLYRRDNGQYVLHRILKVRKTDYVICGDNRYIKEYGITDRHIIGVLSEVVRDGKSIKTSDMRYLIYTHLWCDLYFIRVILFFSRDMLKRIKHKIAKWRAKS